MTSAARLVLASIAGLMVVMHGIVVVASPAQVSASTTTRSDALQWYDEGSGDATRVGPDHWQLVLMTRVGPVALSARDSTLAPELETPRSHAAG
jgi:hypothetical protein